MTGQGFSFHSFFVALNAFTIPLIITTPKIAPYGLTSPNSEHDEMVGFHNFSVNFSLFRDTNTMMMMMIY